MAKLLTQLQGRRALKHVLHTPVVNLNKFNVEPFRANSYAVGAAVVYNNEAGMMRLATLYSSTIVPFLTSTAPVVGLNLQYLNYLAQRHIWKVSLVTTACKGMMADIVAQKVFERKEKLDVRRTGLFFAFGAFYSGCICHALYTWLYPTVFRFRFAPLNAIVPSFFDNFINTPFIFFPIFYAMKETMLVTGGSLNKAYQKWKNEVLEASIASWKMWIPAHVVTFGLMPVHLRIPFASVVSFFYFTMISLQQSVFEARRKNEALL